VNYKIGMKVKVSPKHWLRGNQDGEIAGFNEDSASNKWKIKFNKKGFGIDGQYLFLNENDFVVVPDDEE
jgi:hypothetical protein